MPLVITRKDLERTVELLTLVFENAEDPRDVQDSLRLMQTFIDAKQDAVILKP